jgi:uncharacterized protein (TIGR00251 family)
MVTARPQGSALTITVAPRSSTNRLEMLDDGTLRVRVTAPPVDGAANTALLKVLARNLNVPRSSLAIGSGESSRCKLIVVSGITPDELAERLHVALSKGP